MLQAVATSASLELWSLPGGAAFTVTGAWFHVLERSLLKSSTVPAAKKRCILAPSGPSVSPGRRGHAGTAGGGQCSARALGSRNGMMLLLGLDLGVEGCATAFSGCSLHGPPAAAPRGLPSPRH